MLIKQYHEVEHDLSRQDRAKKKLSLPREGGSVFLFHGSTKFLAAPEQSGREGLKDGIKDEWQLQLSSQTQRAESSAERLAQGKEFGVRGNTLCSVQT